MGLDVTEFLSKMAEIRERAMEQFVKAVDVFGEHVIGDAQQLAPVDTGALKASGTTTPAEMEGNIVKKEIGFNTNYAAAVHENLNAHHKDGQAKFLETAMRENAPKFNAFVAERMEH